MEANSFEDLRRIYDLFCEADADDSSELCEESQAGSTPQNGGKNREIEDSQENQGKLVGLVMTEYANYIVKKGLQVRRAVVFW